MNDSLPEREDGDDEAFEIEQRLRRAKNDYKFLGLMALMVAIFFLFAQPGGPDSGAAYVACIWIAREAYPYTLTKD